MRPKTSDKLSVDFDLVLVYNYILFLVVISGSSWLRAESFFYQLYHGRGGRVSFLMELANCQDSGGKKISTKNIFDICI